MINKKDLLTGFFRKYPALLSFTFLSGLLNSLSSLLIPVFIGKYYQLAFHTHSPRGKLFDTLFIQLNDFNLFLYLFIAVVIARTLFIFLEKYLSGYSAELFSRDLRDNLVQTQLAFSM